MTKEESAVLVGMFYSFTKASSIPFNSLTLKMKRLYSL